jgi:uncharacterized Fe-S center protein
MKSNLRFSVAALASMALVSLISIGVVALYMACNGAGDALAPEKASVRAMPDADGWEPAPVGGDAAVADSSIVYFTKNITPEGLKKVYDALNTPVPAGAKVAVKLSTGEDGSNYLKASLITNFIQSFPGVNIVECNVAYAGAGMTSRRGTTAVHMQLAKDHGFTDIAKVVIMDSLAGLAGSMAIPVARVSGVTRHLDSNYVGKAFANYNHYIVLSHFKGHPMAGLGGAIKNISIGIASVSGKYYIHTAGSSKTAFTSSATDPFQESMAEAGKAVVDYLKSKGSGILYINVMNKLSVDCDCIANQTAPIMAADIGILSSLDPVALDQACVDLVKKASDGTELVTRMGSKNGYLMISHGAKIGLGSQTYKIVDLDKTTSVEAPNRTLPQSAAPIVCELKR